MKYITRSAVFGLVAAAASMSFVGCASTNIDDVSHRSIFSNLTPEMRTTSERPVDVERHMAATNNGNTRAFWNDLGSTFYTDYPSRLSPFPIFSSSGMPR